MNPDDGRIHTTFEQTVAATGRLSSVEPNLQNIPNRNAEGREIRSAFVPGEGYESLLSSDYSQVELRIMADLSGDDALIEAFRSGADFHKYVASLVYGIPVDDITPDQRTHVKAMSYGLAYGLSTYGLAQQLKISPGEADRLKSQYFATFGKVHVVWNPWSPTPARRATPRRCSAGVGIPRTAVAEPQHTRRRRAGSTQRAHPGLGRGHHEDRHDPRVRRACQGQGP